METSRAANRTTVSVLIVNFNGASFLPRCLAALRAQIRPADRVLLVDNASSDDSLAWARAQPDIEVLAPGKNLGFAGANNLGIAACETEFVALLNADAFPEPDWLEQLLRAAEEHPAAASFGSRQLADGHPETLDGIGDVYHLSGLVWRAGHGHPQTPDDLRPREIFSPCAAAALYRRAAVRAVGGFDADFFCYCEDVDLGFRLRLAGHGARYVPGAVVRHVGSVTSGGKHSDFATFHGHRNLVWAFAKNMPAGILLLALPLHFGLTLFSVLLLVARGQGRTGLAAKIAAVRGLPRMWGKRRKIQSARVASSAQIWRRLDKRLWKRSLPS